MSNFLFNLRKYARSWQVAKEMKKPLVLKGECNQCGLCCVVDAPEGGYLKCMNLIVRDWEKIGQPFATRCGYHESRYDGMPIYFVDKQGRLRGESKCHTGPAEREAIIERRLIGKGCSLTLAQDGEA